MKTGIISISLWLLVSIFCSVQAQITVNAEGYSVQGESEVVIDSLKSQKEQVLEEEKAALKKKVIAINKQLKAAEITAFEAKLLKEEAAEKHAQNIEDRLAIIDARIALQERNRTPDKIVFGVDLNLWGKEKNEGDSKEYEGQLKRTTSSVFLAFGLSNAVVENDGLDSPYKVAGSRFFSVGYEFTTAVSKNIRFKYGVGFQFNGLKPTGNRYFVENGDQTLLSEYPLPLKKSKFRNDNLFVPIHVEFGPSEIVRTNDGAYYSTDDQFRFGLGGFVGINLNSVQKLKFKENGDRQKSKLHEGYNTTNFLYGLGVYLGYDWFNLYVRYNLNPLFTDNLVDQHVLALGLRLWM